MDNQSAIRFSKNPEVHTKAKQTSVRYTYDNLTYVNTNKKKADIFINFRLEVKS